MPKIAGKNLWIIFWVILDTFCDFLHNIAYFLTFLNMCIIAQFKTSPYLAKVKLAVSYQYSNLSCGLDKDYELLSED